MHSSQFGKGFFIFLMATRRFPTYSGRVVGCCIGLSIVPLGRGLFQSARHTVPNDPSPTSRITVKSRGPSRIREAAVVGMDDTKVELEDRELESGGADNWGDCLIGILPAPAAGPCIPREAVVPLESTEGCTLGSLDVLAKSSPDIRWPCRTSPFPIGISPCPASSTNGIVTVPKLSEKGTSSPILGTSLLGWTLCGESKTSGVLDFVPLFVCVLPHGQNSTTAVRMLSVSSATTSTQKPTTPILHGAMVFLCTGRVFKEPRSGRLGIRDSPYYFQCGTMDFCIRYRSGAGELESCYAGNMCPRSNALTRQSFAMSWYVCK